MWERNGEECWGVGEVSEILGSIGTVYGGGGCGRVLLWG